MHVFLSVQIDNGKGALNPGNASHSAHAYVVMDVGGAVRLYVVPFAFELFPPSVLSVDWKATNRDHQTHTMANIDCHL